MPYGRTTLGTTGYPVVALATDLEHTSWKVGGITLDWSTIAAVVADILLGDGNLVKAGQKYLRFGQVVARANAAEVETVTFTGGPTTGSAILTVPAFQDFAAYPTAPISATATGPQFEAALQAVPSIGAGGASVAVAGAGTAGSPFVYTITFARRLGAVPALTSTNTFGGGTTPSVTIAITTPGTGTGLFGPYDPAAGDGRQTLTRGECFILNETITQYPPIGWGAPNADNPAVFDGGTVWKDRILMTPTTHALGAGPTVAEFEAAFPDIHYVES